MIEMAYYYGSIAFLISASAIGVGLGQGLASYAAMMASYTQPHAEQDISRATIIGMALMETAAILSLIMIFLLLATSHNVNNWYAHISYLGIAASLGLSSAFTGFCGAFPVMQACHAIARQPFFTSSISRIMMITQTIIQTPLMFGFLIALLIHHQIQMVTDMPNALRLIGAGLSVGLGSIGTAFGLSIFAKASCHALGLNRSALNHLLSFTFMSMAIIETSLLFAFIMSILLLFTRATPDTLLRGIGDLAAGLTVGLGTIAPAISSGRTASAACRHIALDTNKYHEISRVSMLGQSLIESTAIYGFLIGLLLFILI